MATAGDYKADKEAFVSGATGSSVGHVNMVSVVALVYVALCLTDSASSLGLGLHCSPLSTSDTITTATNSELHNGCRNPSRSAALVCDAFRAISWNASTTLNCANGAGHADPGS